VTTTFHLYVGLPKNLDQPTQQRMIDTINKRHPDAVADEILDGYWSGVEETTLLIKVVTRLEYVQQTADILKTMANGFVAIDEPED
jgi:hypothetical protein